jgi:hypothetical protein
MYPGGRELVSYEGLNKKYLFGSYMLFLLWLSPE